MPSTSTFVQAKGYQHKRHPDVAADVFSSYGCCPLAGAEQTTEEAFPFCHNLKPVQDRLSASLGAQSLYVVFCLLGRLGRQHLLDMVLVLTISLNDTEGLHQMRQEERPDPDIVMVARRELRKAQAFARGSLQKGEFGPIQDCSPTMLHTEIFTLVVFVDLLRP